METEVHVKRIRPNRNNNQKNNQKSKEKPSSLLSTYSPKAGWRTPRNVIQPLLSIFKSNMSRLLQKLCHLIQFSAFVILTTCVLGNLSAWQENVRPKLYVELGKYMVLCSFVWILFTIVGEDGENELRVSGALWVGPPTCMCSRNCRMQIDNCRHSCSIRKYIAVGME